MLGERRACREQGKDGKPCRATPQREVDVCFWHDPDHAQEAKEARRLGGVRRRREGVIQGTYDLEELGSIAQIRRLVHVAVMDTLALENGVNRNRALGSLAMTAIKLLEAGEMEERLQALEAVMEPKLKAVGGRR